MLKIIGAGLPRTGTLSQKAALEMLGFGPCYHMVNLLGDLSKVDVWRRVYAGELAAADALDGFASSVDWPGSWYFEQLMDAYPDAPVLLSARDGDAWEHSMRQTIYDSIWGDSLMADLARARMRVDPAWDAYIRLMSDMWRDFGIVDGRDAAEGSLARAMEAYNDRVRETVPADRLIEWAPADGWEPLCSRLDIPIPEAPVPRLNDSATFKTMIIDACLAVITGWRESQRAGAAVAPAAAV
jgi:hypothetical protein